MKMLCLLSYPFINKILHFFIFTKNTCRYQPISRTQAYRIVKTAAGKTVQDERDEIYLKLELWYLLFCRPGFSESHIGNQEIGKPAGRYSKPDKCNTETRRTD